MSVKVWFSFIFLGFLGIMALVIPLFPLDPNLIDPMAIGTPEPPVFHIGLAQMI